MTASSSFLQRVRPWAKRAAIAGGAASVTLVAFPRLEDAYWMRKDPQRVKAGESLEDDYDAVTAAKNQAGQSKGNDNNSKKKKDLLILGTGWTSVSVLKHIDRDKYNVTIVSPRNFFLFTPLLPSVCAGTVTPHATSIPIRELTSYKALPYLERLRFMWRGYLPDPVKYVYAAASDVDPENKVVTCEHQSTTIANNAKKPASFHIPYDILVVGTGAVTNTFNTEGVHEHAHYLKETGDASLLRQAVLENLEKASLPATSEEERQRLLSFWVVGGGPTAVEFAAELQDFLHYDVVNPKHATFHECAGKPKVTLVQSGPELLPGYPRKIRDFSLKHLKDCGINVITEKRATKLTENKISVYDKATETATDHPYGLAVWATGVTPAPLIQTLIGKIPPQASYRTLKTDSRCEVIGGPDIYAAGDCADIDVEVEYEAKVCAILDRLNTKFAGQRNANGKLLSEEAREELLQELQTIGGIVSAPGAKITKAIADRFEEEAHKQENGDGIKGLSSAEARSIVQKHMARQKVLPPTAQVAHQQGEYLAKLFNKPKIDGEKWTYGHDKGFEFRNLGQMVYVGGHMAALSIPATKDYDVSWNGTLTNYLWHAAYFGMLESVASRSELLFDWFKTSIFGRSTALEAICAADSTKHADILRRGAQVENDKKEASDKRRPWWKML